MMPDMPKVDLGRPATYDDLVAVPDILVAEIVDGELWTSPRPAPRHALAASQLGAQLTVQFGQSVVGLLEERAARAPEQPVLLSYDAALRCGQVNEQANRLAGALIGAGVEPGEVVAIMVDRSPRMVLGLLAILKAGAAYLPIDPEFPQQRIEYILRDSGARFRLGAADAARMLEGGSSSPSVRCIRIDEPSSYASSGANPGRKVSPADPAYVIYTSGSMGQPKAVVVEHGALMNTLQYLEDSYRLAGKTILLKTNFTFDVSAAELFGWLFADGRLAVLDRGAERDPVRLLDAIARFGVTHVNFVPSMLDAFLANVRDRDVATLVGLEYVFYGEENF